jgi:pantoate kinase
MGVKRINHGPPAQWHQVLMNDHSFGSAVLRSLNTAEVITASTGAASLTVADMRCLVLLARDEALAKVSPTMRKCWPSRGSSRSLPSPLSSAQ